MLIMKKKISKADILDLMWNAWMVTDGGVDVEDNGGKWVLEARQKVTKRHKEILAKYLDER